MGDVRDQWAAGSAYEAFMGRWSRRLAPEFIAWLHPARALHWLDIGCGTGALTDALCAHAHPASVLGCDPAAPLIEFARARGRDPRPSFAVAGIGNLPHRDGGYGGVTSLFALNFLPDPAAAVAEMRSVTTPGATVSACVWDYGGGMQFLRYFWHSAGALDPAAAPLDEGHRFPLCRQGALSDLFRESGLLEVRCEPVTIDTPFASFEDYWRPFLGGTGPAPSYVASLADADRDRLARHLRAALPTGPGGEILLSARAWAVRGTVAG